jgi:hypothetical protein
MRQFLLFSLMGLLGLSFYIGYERGAFSMKKTQLHPGELTGREEAKDSPSISKQLLKSALQSRNNTATLGGV